MSRPLWAEAGQPGPWKGLLQWGRFLGDEAPAQFGAIWGAVAEWLRSGLQSRVHRFDSGPRLHA